MRGDRRAADRSDDRGRALPRRARRLAGGAADAVRRPRPRAVVDGHRGAPPRASRRRRPGDVVRRRDRGAPAGGDRDRWRDDRVGAAHRAGRDRGAADGRAGRLGAVRRPLPRERGPRAAAAAPPSGTAHAAVDAAPEVGRPAGGRQPLRLVPDHPRDVPRGAARRVRHAGAASSCSASIRSRQIRVVSVETRSASPFAQLAGVRLRRLVHVRGRRAARRAARAGARPRPRPAGRAARHGGAARAASTRRRSPTSSSSSRRWPTAAAPGRSTAWPTCCGGWATCGPTRSRRAAPTASTRPPRCGELEARPTRGARADRRRGALDRDRGRRPATATRSAPARRRASPRRGWRRPTRRSTRCSLRWARSARAVHRRRAGRALGRRSRHGRGAARGRWPPPGRCSRAPSGPAARPTSSPIPTSCASCGAARWRACVARWSRSSRRSSPASCRRGTASASTAGGLGRLVEVVAQLEGVPIPASVLERDVLPARVAGYTPRLLDELGAAGEVVWVGRGSLGRDDGRDRALPPRPGRAPRQRRRARRTARPSRSTTPSAQHLQRRGASFFPQLRAAVGEARSDDELLDALWDLVWAGEVTNDTFAAAACALAARGRARRRRPVPGRLVALGPPRAAGRWSLVADLVGEERTPTERGHALATSLLERHGVVTREAVAAEGIAGGLRIGLPGAARDGGVRPRAARLLRGRPRRGPVRPARRGRPAPGRAGRR